MQQIRQIKIIDITNNKELSFEPTEDIKLKFNMQHILEKIELLKNNIYYIPTNEKNPRHDYQVCIKENDKETSALGSGSWGKIREQVIKESSKNTHFNFYINNSKNTKLKISAKLSNTDKLVLEFEGRKNKEYIKEQKINTKSRDKDENIIKQKKKIGDYFFKYMSEWNKSLHSITFSTGSGKSYNAFEAIIRKVQYDIDNDIKKPNLFLFIAPLKSQLGINSKVKKELVNNNVFIFRDLSIEDRYSTNELNNTMKEFLYKIYDKFNNNNYTSIPFISEKNKKGNIYKNIENIYYKITKIIELNEEIKELDTETEQHLIYDKQKWKSGLTKNIEQNISNIIELIIRKSGQNFKRENISLYKYLINLIGYFNPFNILSVEKNILITPTTSKNITNIYSYKQLKEDNIDIENKEYEKTNSSFNSTGKNIFEILSTDDDNNILNEANISIFIDESTEAFFTYRENYLKNVSTKFIIPELVETFKKQVNIDIKYKNLMELIYKKKKDGNETELYNFFKSIETTYNSITEDLELINIFKELHSDKTNVKLYTLEFKKDTYVKLLKDFIDLNRYNNFNSIIEMSEIYYLLNTNSSKFDINENILFDFFSLHNKFDKELYMDKSLMVKYEMVFNKIFHTQSNGVFTSHKKELNKLFIHAFDNSLEVKENNNSKITLYEYIQSVLFILNILSNNNKASKSKYKKLKGYIPGILEDLKEPINETSSSNLYAVSKNLKTAGIYKKIFTDISLLASNGKSPIIDKEFYFKTPKLIINIKDNGEHKKSGNKQRNSLGFYFYYQINTVENMLIEAFKYDKGDLNIFKMSATDGIEGNHYDYDDEFIYEELKNINVPYYPYTQKEDKNSFFQEDTKISEIEQITIDINNSRTKDIFFINKEPKQTFTSFNKYTLNILETFNKNKKNVNQKEKTIFNLSNIRYKTLEISNMLNYINNFYDNKEEKAALLFTQTTINIHLLLDTFIINNTTMNGHFYIKKIEYGDLLRKNQGIYDIKDKITNKTILRLILFKSKMDIYIDEKNSKIKDYKSKSEINDSELNWEQIMNTDDNKVLMISDYKNAGIGVSFTQNNIINGEVIEKDFDALIFNNDVFYTRISSIKDNHIDYFLFQSHYVQKNELQWDYNLNNLHELNTDDDFLSHLSYTESILYIIGIIQNIGRAERKDNNDNLKVYIPTDIMSKIGVYYNNLNKIDKNRMKYNSNANIQLQKQSLELINKISLTDKEYQLFNDFQYSKYKVFNKVKNEIVKVGLNSFREDNNQLQSYNQWEALRDINSWNNPDIFIEKLKDSNLFSIEFINSLYLNSNLENIDNTNIYNKMKSQLFRCSKSNAFNYDKPDVYKVLYSDAKHTTTSSNIDFYQILKIKHILDKNKDNKVTRLLDSVLNYNTKLFEEKIPTLSFLQDILAPFFLEQLLANYLTQQYGNKKHYKIFNTIDYKGEFHFLYEFGDSFIYNILTKTLTLIDAKSWSKISDNKLSKNTIITLQNKIETIKQKTISNNNLSIEIKKIEGLFVSIENEDGINLGENNNIRSSHLFYYDKKNKYRDNSKPVNLNYIETANIEINHSKSEYKLNPDILK